MSGKRLGMYGGFFVVMLLVALFTTGVFQQGILPRITGAGASEKARGEGGEDGMKTDAEAKGETAPGKPPESSQPATPVGAPGTPPVTAPAAPALVAAQPPVSDSKAAEGKAAERGVQLKRLTRMYERMRPKEAASVLEKLERPLAVSVLSEMKEREAAKILGVMNPATAAEMTQLIGRTSEGNTP